MKTRRLAIQTALAVAAVPLARAGQDHTHPGALVEIEAAKREAKFFGAAEMKTLARVVDLIIPRTDTPGASDAGVHYIIDSTARARKTFGAEVRRGIASLNTECRKKNGKAFLDVTEARQVALLQAFSEESGTSRAAFFKTMKDQTIDGYYGSKEGLMQELGWNANTFLKEFPGCTHAEHKA